MAKAGIGKVFGDMPGSDRVGGLVLRRIQGELAKLDPETLHKYLGDLEDLAYAVRSGEGFEEMMAQ